MNSAIGLGLSPLLPLAAWATTPRDTLRIATRVLDIDGRAASVYSLTNQLGGHGLVLNRADGFDLRLINDLTEDSIIHWHGLTPPVEFDGVPELSQPPLRPGQEFDYKFDLRRGGTHWMHSHLGGQEQNLLAAPLIIHDGAPEMQEVVIILHDFSFRGPDEIYFELTGKRIGDMDHAAHMAGGGGMMTMDHSAMGHDMEMDLNDVEFDAYLANDRTLNDPEQISVAPNSQVRLRIINAAASTNFWMQMGGLDARLVAVDGIDVVQLAGSEFPITMAQRLDIIVTIPADGAFPILAQREGALERTGVVLKTPGAVVARIAATADSETLPVLHQLESRLQTAEPLAARAVDVALNLHLTGDMMEYSWGLGAPAPLQAMLGHRVEITMHNMSIMAHPMHLHGHSFQVVDVGNGRMNGALRDTVMVPPMGQVTIAFDADNPGRWAFHCHNMYHMLAGMMTSFEVVA